MGIWSRATTGEVHFEIACFGFIDISPFLPVSCFAIHPCGSCSSCCGCPLGDELVTDLSPLARSHGARRYMRTGSANKTCITRL